MSRAAGRAPRGAPAIDIHAHYFPEAYLAVLEERGPAFGIRVDRSDPAGPAIGMGPALGGVLRREFFDLKARLREMNRTKVTVHALSLTFPMVDWADADLGAQLARTVNDALSAAHTAYPDRFVGLATLPMQDPKAAVEEIDRVARRPGIRGVYLATNINSRDLDDPAFLPVWERIAAVGFPAFLHPMNVIGAQRLGPYLRRFTYDTISHGAVPLRYLIDVVGADRVMLGSDYCFDLGYERPVEVVTRLGRLSSADQAKILGGNAARLLRLR